MAFTSTLSLYSHPQQQVLLRHQRLQSLAVTAAQFVWLPILKSQRSRALVVRSFSSIEGTPSCAAGSRGVYLESHANAPLSIAPVKQIATAVAPFGVELALIFVIWKLWEKIGNELKKREQEMKSYPRVDVSLSGCNIRDEDRIFIADDSDKDWWCDYCYQFKCRCLPYSKALLSEFGSDLEVLRHPLSLSALQSGDDDP